MVKRYYCDYCDTSYPYSVEARKKHSHGHFHQKLKKLHYDQFKTAKDKLEDGMQKEKCRNYHSGRHCTFGDSCIYSHLTNAELEVLKQDAMREEEVTRQSKIPTLEKSGTNPTVEKWESILVGDQGHSCHQSTTNLTEAFKDKYKYKLPNHLQEHSNLPPSLIPPSIDRLLSCSFQEWG